jgi:hypothetical protein
VSVEITEHTKRLKDLSETLDYRDTLKKRTSFYSRALTTSGSIAAVLILKSALFQDGSYHEVLCTSIFFTYLFAPCQTLNLLGINNAHKKALDLYIRIHTERIGPYGKLMSRNDINFPHALNKEQFVEFGKRLGFSYDQLLDRARVIERADVTDYIQRLNGNRRFCGEPETGPFNQDFGPPPEDEILHI